MKLASYGVKMNELALFAGAGGGILGGKLLGWRTVCAVERDAYASQVLAQRQNDGLLEAFPIWSDITTFDGKPWRGIVDVVSGGFPCQDISAAGKGAGIEGARSGMWKEMARIIGEVRPKYAFVENSPMLTTRGLGTVLADLAAMGFDAEWGVLSAADIGANHQRERIWIVAKQRNIFSHTEHDRDGRWKQQQESTAKEIKSRNTKWKLSNTDLLRCENRQTKINTTNTRLDALSEFSASGANVADTNSKYGIRWCKSQLTTSFSRKAWNKFTWRSNEVCNTSSIRQSRQRESIQPMCSTKNENWQTNIIKSISKRSQWETEPNVGRVVNGLAFGMDRLKAIGNGQVPLCAATAFNLLRDRLDK